MRLLVLGGSGRTGSLIIADALEQGYTVTALARRTSSLEARPGLTTIEGSTMDTQDIARAIDSAPEQDPVQAVLVCLAASRESDSPWAKPLAPPSFLRDSARSVLQAMRPRGMKRIIVLSAFGSGKSWSQFPCAFKLLFNTSNMKHELADHNAVERELWQAGEKWGLQWTIAKPTILKGEQIKLREFGEDGKGIGMFDSCSRPGVAQWMLDSVENKGKSQRVVCLAT